LPAIAVRFGAAQRVRWSWFDFNGDQFGIAHARHGPHILASSHSSSYLFGQLINEFITLFAIDMLPENWTAASWKILV
jgi:hypothetical protein